MAVSAKGIMAQILLAEDDDSMRDFLAKALTRLHGGKLSIDSTPGAGTTITVVFPKERLLQPEKATAHMMASG